MRVTQNGQRQVRTSRKLSATTLKIHISAKHERDAVQVALGGRGAEGGAGAAAEHVREAAAAAAVHQDAGDHRRPSTRR